MADIYFDNPELKSAVSRFGATGQEAENDFLRKAHSFDPMGAIRNYSTGAFNSFKSQLGQFLDDRDAAAVGRGALNTGFHKEGQNVLVRQAIQDLEDKVLQQSVTGAQLGLQNTGMLGSYAQNQNQTYIDALSGLTTSKAQQEQQDKASKRSFWGQLGGGILSGVGTGLALLSDKSAKEGVEGIESALEKLKELEGYLFQYTPEAQSMGAPPGQQAGVMAQDVEQAMPGAVGERGGMKTVDHAAITGLLTEAVKELEGRLAALEGPDSEEAEGPEEAAGQTKRPRRKAA